MKPSTSLILLGAASVAEAVTGQLGDAIPSYDNPRNAVYEAVLPANNALGIKGSIKASTDFTGAVSFTVNFANLPATGGPFLYHLHVDPVPEDGNCTKTLAHLDPYIRGEAEPCDATQPATCQVGDLSGKHGKPNFTSFNASYVDPYPVLKPGLGSFFGNRSFVLHFANKTRIGCANFFAIDAPPPPTQGLPFSNTSGPANPPAGVFPPAPGTGRPGVISLPNAPSYAGGAAAGIQNASVPNSGSASYVPNNGLSSQAANVGGGAAANYGSTSGNMPQVQLSNDAGVAAVSRGLAVAVGLLAAAVAGLV